MRYYLARGDWRGKEDECLLRVLAQMRRAPPFTRVERSDGVVLSVKLPYYAPSKQIIRGYNINNKRIIDSKLGRIAVFRRDAYLWFKRLKDLRRVRPYNANQMWERRKPRTR